MYRRQEPIEMTSDGLRLLAEDSGLCPFDVQTSGRQEPVEMTSDGLSMLSEDSGLCPVDVQTSGRQ